MNFINKQYIVRFQTGQHTCQISRLVKYRTGSNLKSYSQFIGNDVTQGCFSQSGRAVQQHVIQSFGTQTGCLDKDAQVVYNLVLPAEVLKLQRTKRILKVPFLTGRFIVTYIKLFFHDSFDNYAKVRKKSYLCPDVVTNFFDYGAIYDNPPCVFLPHSYFCEDSSCRRRRHRYGTADRNRPHPG